jgi:hypothetical protein
LRSTRILLGLLVTLLAGSDAWAETMRLFAVPPTQSDNTMSTERPAQVHGPSDVGRLTGGIVFGLSPNEVNALLPKPAPGFEWAGLPNASEYPDDVRYFWVRLDTTADLRAGVNACAGTNSYVVFLFGPRGLFRVSWRLLPDNECPSTPAAAEDIFGRYLTIDQAALLATHYRAGKAEAVEITDPTASYLIPYRWDNRRR